MNTEEVLNIINANPMQYVALLSQSGTADPTVIVLKNTIGTTVTWVRDGAAGTYKATKDDATDWTIANTTIEVGGFWDGSAALTSKNIHAGINGNTNNPRLYVTTEDSNKITILGNDVLSAPFFTDDILNYTMIKITVY